MSLWAIVDNGYYSQTMREEVRSDVCTEAKGSDSRRDSRELRSMVDEIVASTPIIDLHTHLFAPQFGSLNLWGIDELLTYHYLIAEFFRSSSIQPAAFWDLEKPVQADLIWKMLFVENTPISEAARGVVCVLSALGLDTCAQDLTEAREFFASQNSEDYLDRILKIAGVSDVVMTNDPLDEIEIRTWQDGTALDSRFHAALRIDRIVNGWEDATGAIRAQGYKVGEEIDARTVLETRGFLDNWIAKMEPVYLAASLPDDFNYPEDSFRGRLLHDVILPTCLDHNIPLALMIGVRRHVNPELRSAGDGLGQADVGAIARICVENPDVRFLVTFLSRENQHELCVTARKFSNLTPFGCWWFLNNPSIISEITRERFELLGTGFIPQHSDARVLDQLIYKWKHSRFLIADALFESYANLERDGRRVTEQEIKRDAVKLFSGNFLKVAGHDDQASASWS
jgi:hypothetical protein